jgi:DNA-binding CsgD family transcriptional regulator
MPMPKREIDEETIEEMASKGLTNGEIVSILKCSNTTILRYKEALALGRANMRMSLRRRQVQIALEADPKIAITMLIWLGKQYLGQSDKNKLGGIDGWTIPIPVEVTDARSKLAAKLSERTSPAS